MIDHFQPYTYTNDPTEKDLKVVGYRYTSSFYLYLVYSSSLVLLPGNTFTKTPFSISLFGATATLVFV